MSLLDLLTLALLASHASALPGDMAFGFRPSYNNVPDLANPGAFEPDIVVYSLPATGSIYAGPADSFFDVFARVDGGGTQMVSDIQAVLLASGTGQVQFNPSPFVVNENNVGSSLNPDFPSLDVFDRRLALVDILPPGGGRTVGFGLAETALLNHPVTHNDGLLAMPIRVAGGTSGFFDVDATALGNFGFSKTVSESATEFLTHTQRFPHLNGVIEVRPSVRGDFNGDLVVDFRDWSGFNAARDDLDAFQAQYPWLHARFAGDFNEDGALNAADVPAFRQLAGVPEPSAIALAVAAAVLLPLTRRRL